MANLKQLRETDLSTLCLWCGLQQDSGDKKQFKGDGFRINVTGFSWYDHESKCGNGGAINLLMHVKRLEFTQAVQLLETIDLGNVAVSKAYRRVSEHTSQIPARYNDNMNHVFDYLNQQRGITAKLILWCIDSGMIYADGFKNAVFMYGKLGCELRGTGKKKWRSARGKLEQPFLLPCKNTKSIAIVESAIDALSYRQLHNHAVASIGGNGNKKIITDLVNLAKAKGLSLIGAFDNDNGGDTANSMLLSIAQQHDVTVTQNRPIVKDWNQTLLNKNTMSFD